MSDGLRVPVRVKPGSSRPRVGGEHAGRLVVAVAERAVEGKATEAALAALAKAFGVRRTAVRLVSGATNRSKVVHIDGDTDRLSVRHEALLAG